MQLRSGEGRVKKFTELKKLTRNVSATATAPSLLQVDVVAAIRKGDSELFNSSNTRIG